MFNFYATVESIRVDLIERSLDSFYLAYKNTEQFFYSKSGGIFRASEFYMVCFSNVLSQTCLAMSSN